MSIYINLMGTSNLIDFLSNVIGISKYIVKISDFARFDDNSMNTEIPIKLIQMDIVDLLC